MGDIPAGYPVYRAKVKRAAPALGGAFVSLGDSDALLHTRMTYQSGRTLVVQVVEPPKGSKLAVVEDRVGYPGRTLVYLPNGDGIQYSRSLSVDARQALQNLHLPSGGWIVRSLAAAVAPDVVEAEAETMLAQWQQLPTGVGYLFTPDTDWKALCARAQTVLCNDNSFCRMHPELPLVFRADLTEREPTLGRVVVTPQGVNLVWDATEAAMVVDVNSGTYMPAMTPQAQSMAVNRIAAKELVRQLLLRDVTGVVLVDFVTMSAAQMAVLMDYLADLAARYDPRLRLVDCTKLGWVELTRASH